MDTPKRTFTIPPWFPRNPLLHGEEEQEECSREWNKYLLIPKGDPRRKVYLENLKKRYADSYTLLHHAEQEPTPDPEGEQELREHLEEHAARQRPTKKQAVWLEEEPALRSTQASTHYTPKQTELAKFVRMSMELLARSNDATILDMRKAYEYWLNGHCNSK